MKPKNCPHCGASIPYSGRRDLVTHIARVVSRLGRETGHNWGDAYALGYLSGTLETALGLCSSPGCSATTAASIKAYFDRLHADDDARSRRLDEYVERLRERVEKRKRDAVQPLILTAATDAPTQWDDKCTCGHVRAGHRETDGEGPCGVRSGGNNAPCSCPVFTPAWMTSPRPQPHEESNG